MKAVGGRIAARASRSRTSAARASSRPGAADFERYWAVVRWQSDYVERSRPLDESPVGTIGVVRSERIVYTEHWLRREGYAPRQFWRADDAADDGAPDGVLS